MIRSIPPMEPPAERQRWLRAELADPGSMWRDITVVPQTSSTNADLAAQARSGAAGGAVLVADHQTAGRGRLDRSWVAPPGTSLTVSMLLRPQVEVARWSWLPLITGMALASTLVATRVNASLKWPNDVMVADRKLAGILTEAVSTPTGSACVIGWGLNTRMTLEQLPMPTATSLWVEGARTVSSVVLLATMLRRFQRIYTEWAGGDHDDGLRESYQQLCGTIGRQIQVTLTDQRTLDGTASGIDETGRLLVRTADGVEAVAAGDVVHARPASGGSPGDLRLISG